jgi:hypothetical protein
LEKAYRCARRSKGHPCQPITVCGSFCSSSPAKKLIGAAIPSHPETLISSTPSVRPLAISLISPLPARCTPAASISQWLPTCGPLLPRTWCRRSAAAPSPHSARPLSPTELNGPRGPSSTRLLCARPSDAPRATQSRPSPSGGSASCAGHGVSPSSPPSQVWPTSATASTKCATRTTSPTRTQARRRLSC